MDSNARIAAIVEKRTAELVALRRKLHQHPELAFEEHETAKAVGAFLDQQGITFKTGIGKTGIVAVVEGAKPGPTLGIRADMDALPILEQTGLPFASKLPGKMHACGHDVHTVIALGVAAALSEMRDSLSGKVKFIFQPAEETLSGAQAMIADGVLDDPKMDLILGYHNWPAVPAGKVGYNPDVVMASADAFDITLQGREGHGAHPHMGIDALAAAAQLVSQLQTIVSREVKPISPRSSPSASCTPAPRATSSPGRRRSRASCARWRPGFRKRSRRRCAACSGASRPACASTTRSTGSASRPRYAITSRRSPGC